MGNLTTKQKDVSGDELVDFGTPIQTKQYSQLDKDQTDSAKSLWKNLFSNWDPRSPSQFIARTPLWKLRGSANQSANPSVEFTELMNDSVVSVNLEILTALEEEEMRQEAARLPEIDPNFDPRSPSTTITRTPILFDEQQPKEETLLKNLTKKLMTNTLSTTKVSPVGEPKEEIPKNNKLNLVYEDFEDLRFSTPPKKGVKDIIVKSKDDTPRTPLSCLANKRNAFANNLSSTPKQTGNKVFNDENSVTRSNSKIPVFRSRIN